MSPATNLSVDTHTIIYDVHNDTEYVHVTLLYSSSTSLQKHCNDRLSRDVHHTRHLTSFNVCLCHCTEERGRRERERGGGGGEENDKNIVS